MSMLVQASAATGLSLIGGDGVSDLPHQIYLDNGAQQTHIHLQYARARKLRIEVIDQYVTMADGRVTQVAVYLDPVVLIACLGTPHEVRISLHNVLVMLDAEPWFQVLLGQNVHVALGLHPFPELGVAFYNSGHAYQHTLPVNSVQRRHPSLGAVPRLPDIEFVGFDRQQRHQAPASPAFRVPHRLPVRESGLGPSRVSVLFGSVSLSKSAHLPDVPASSLVSASQSPCVAVASECASQSCVLCDVSVPRPAEDSSQLGPTTTNSFVSTECHPQMESNPSTIPSVSLFSSTCTTVVSSLSESLRPTLSSPCDIPAVRVRLILSNDPDVPVSVRLVASHTVGEKIILEPFLSLFPPGMRTSAWWQFYCKYVTRGPMFHVRQCIKRVNTTRGLWERVHEDLASLSIPASQPVQIGPLLDAYQLALWQSTNRKLTIN